MSSVQSVTVNVCLFLLVLFVLQPEGGWCGAVDELPRLVGKVRTCKVREGESLIEIAREHQLGFNEIVGANRGLDPFVPGTGREVVLPTAWLVPEGVKPGRITVNLSEMRLYLVEGQGRRGRVTTFPVGIGSEGNATPVGLFTITGKIINPAWHVPGSIRDENPGLPAIVPPGPDNPLGSHALRLSAQNVMIHGTNRPWGVGRAVSHGCIRLYPEDIPLLFRMARSGMEVAIVREPVKLAEVGGRIFIEIHDEPHHPCDYLNEATRLIINRGVLDRIGVRRLFGAIRDKSGMPVDITR